MRPALIQAPAAVSTGLASLDAALAAVLAAARPVGEERVPIGDAEGAVLARVLVASRDTPATDIAAMDGYAVRDSDLADAWNPLRIAGESRAGQGFALALPARAAVRIFTGAPIPAGATRVVVQEDVHRDGERVLVPRPDCGKRHIRANGSDFRSGDTLLPAHTRLGPMQLVAAAGADRAELDVFTRPRVAILATGDELRAPGEAGATAAVPDSVSLGIAALARRSGAAVAAARRLPDELDVLRAAASAALRSANVVVTIGGASVGDRDFSRSMFAHEDPRMLFSKVAMRPGKPVWFAHAADNFILGLPGNPTAAMFCARLFLVPLLAGLSGLDPRGALAWRRCALAEPVEATDQWERVIGARWDGDAVLPLASRDSSAQAALATTELLIRRGPHCGPAAAGDLVDILEF